ncbi:MAG: ABC transporter permease [Myxococcales bacterium]
MTKHLLQRLLWAVFVLWVVMSGVFLLVNVLGDPAVATLGPNAGPAQLTDFREQHGLTRPLPQRYLEYMTSLLRLDLGRSFQDDREVLDLIATRLPRTMLLGGLTLLLELAIGLGLGTLAAVRRNSWLDSGIMGLTFLGVSTPTFVSGLLFLSYFAVRLGWFPVGGYGAGTWDHLRHACLPALTLALAGASTYARLMRSELIEVLGSDFVRTARAKGLSYPRVVLVHGVRNALLPVITMLGLSLRILVSGAIITEAVFGWPGMGLLAVQAISGLDLPVVLGIVFVTCGFVQLGNVLADGCVAILDPRVRAAD